MNRKDFYFRQKVTEAELDAAFDETENAIDRIFTDLGLIGVAFGLNVAQQVAPNMTVQVSGPGVAYDQLGQRIAIAATQNVDLAVDEAAVSTTVAAPGNSKILSIFAEFDRVLSDPRVDGNAVTIYYERAESFRLNVAQGAEAVTPVAPPLRGDQILLADVTITFGTTQITNGMISTARREVVITIAGSPHSVSATSFESAIGQVLGFLNDHVTASADRHNATAIDYSGGGAWADGSTNPAATVAAQLTKIIADLSPTTSSASGARKIGIEQLASTWQDASTVAAGTLYAMVNSIVGTLASTTASASGARKLGIEALGAWADGTSNGATSIYSRISGIISGLASTSGGASGAAKIGIDALGNWADATASGAAGTLRASVAKIVSDLAASTGVLKIGANALTSTSGSTSIVAGTLRSQLLALLDAAEYPAAFASRAAWTRQVAPANPMIAVVRGNGHYVAVGESGRVYRSQSGDETWTNVAVAGSPMFRDLATNSSSLYVAVGDSGAIYSSPDGNTWTQRGAGLTANNLNAVTFNSALGVWVAVGNAGTILSSSDGTTWTLRTSGTANNLTALLKDSVSLFVVGDAGNARTSPDGTTWTARTIGDPFGVLALHHNGTNYIAGCGTNGAGRIYTSPDAVTWTQRATLANGANTLASNGARVVATELNGGARYSADSGVNWTQSTGETEQAYATLYDPINGLFVSVGEYASIQLSPDGVRWVTVRHGNDAGRAYRAICRYNGRLVVVGGSDILCSD